MPIVIDGITIIQLYDKNESEGETSATEIFKLEDQGVAVFRRPLIKFNLGYTSTNYSSSRRTVGVEVIPSPGNPIRANYSFKGWYTSASGGSKLTFPVTVPNQDEVTYYAQWEELVQITATPTLGSVYCYHESGTNVAYMEITNNDNSKVNIYWGRTLRGSLNAGETKGIRMESGFKTDRGYSYTYRISAQASGKEPSSEVSKSGTIFLCSY